MTTEMVCFLCLSLHSQIPIWLSALLQLPWDFEKLQGNLCAMYSQHICVINSCS